MPLLPACSVSAALLAACMAALVGCGGGGGGVNDSSVTALTAAAPAGTATPAAANPPSIAQAVRLASQATFGASEPLLAEIQSKGVVPWVEAQLALDTSRYSAGGSAAINQLTDTTAYCDQASHAGPNCWRDNFSTQPLVWDFYRNALVQPDQLRQRVAFALSQVLVVSNVDTEGTYGFRRYHNQLLANAFGNYRALLRNIAVSPVMGEYLNNVNNHRIAPNENFARELLQLFSLGTCQLNADGTLVSGDCKPTYDNATVRAYAYALTGWTYPAGGRSAQICRAPGPNCRFLDGDMVPLPPFHDTAPRRLLAGVTLTANHDAPTALEAVLDSLMTHPNLAPFVATRLIQHLVTSNPSAAYVGHVAKAFASGSFRSGAAGFGSGTVGDLAATVAAVLLDDEARSDTPAPTAGRLREPVLLFTGVLRAVDGYTDGDALGFAIGGDLRQIVFRPPSVFSFYPNDYPVAGTKLVGPSFGVHNANTALARLNFLSYLMDLNGSAPDPSVPGATGTGVDLRRFEADADDPGVLLDRLARLALGAPLPAVVRAKAINAVAWWSVDTGAEHWRNYRVRTAAYLVFAAPAYQVQR